LRHGRRLFEFVADAGVDEAAPRVAVQVRVAVEQLLQTVSALTSSGATVNSSASGATTGGLSRISLRGLTSLRTLR
jgi:hypothetical protein